MSRYFSTLVITALGLTLLLPLAPSVARTRESQSRTDSKSAPATEERQVIYKQHNVADFDALLLEGNLKNPNEFYFVHRTEEKFGSLVKKRKNFHKELLRDAVMMQ